MNTGVAIVVGLVLVAAIGGYAYYSSEQERRRQELARQPGALIGAGVGNIVAGIIGAVA